MLGWDFTSVWNNDAEKHNIIYKGLRNDLIQSFYFKEKEAGCSESRW